MKNKLKLLFGDDYIINQKLSIHQPRIDDVINRGEEKYYSIVSALTVIPSDIKFGLYDAGIDWMECTDLELFHAMTNRMPPEDTGLFFGNLDFRKFVLGKNDDGDLFMYNKESDVYIDYIIHKLISNFICNMHMITKKPERAMNALTKKALIDEDKRKREKDEKKPFVSSLYPLISSMVNSAGFKYGYEEIRHMALFQFFDAVARIETISATNNLARGYYSGSFGKEFDVKKLIWTRDLST